MPTVFTDDGLSYRIYTADHRAAHVHVVGGGREAVFELRCPDGPPELREVHGFRFARTKRIAAVSRASAARSEGPTTTDARFDTKRRVVVIALSTGVELSFAPELAQGLEAATPGQLSNIEITPSGLGLHWPEIDADLYLPALLQGVMGSKVWMAESAARLGAVGGRARTPQEVAAARENGRKGERTVAATPNKKSGGAAPKAATKAPRRKKLSAA